MPRPCILCQSPAHNKSCEFWILDIQYWIWVPLLGVKKLNGNKTLLCIYFAYRCLCRALHSLRSLCDIVQNLFVFSLTWWTHAAGIDLRNRGESIEKLEREFRKWKYWECNYIHLTGWLSGGGMPEGRGWGKRAESAWAVFNLFLLVPGHTDNCSQLVHLRINIFYVHILFSYITLPLSWL